MHIEKLYCLSVKISINHVKLISHCQKSMQVFITLSVVRVDVSSIKTASIKLAQLIDRGDMGCIYIKLCVGLTNEHIGNN